MDAGKIARETLGTEIPQEAMEYGKQGDINEKQDMKNKVCMISFSSNEFAVIDEEGPSSKSQKKITVKQTKVDRIPVPKLNCETLAKGTSSHIRFNTAN